LWEKDDRAQRDLAAAIERDAATTSRIVDAMERAGLVARKADPADARGKRIVLTAKSVELRGVLVPVVKKLVARMEAGIAERELERTRDVLERLTKNLADD
jgi:DNA-binding MarR family transcriptional regulator